MWRWVQNFFLKNRFNVVVGLHMNISQITTKCVKYYIQQLQQNDKFLFTIFRAKTGQFSDPRAV
jgi:hypothetical protein